jgi:hypothetical protein
VADTLQQLPDAADKFTAVSDKRVQRLGLILAVIYIVCIQIPLLSPFRPIPLDEVFIVDSAYTLASGVSPVPASVIWSHIIPEFGTINFYYTPLYFYLLAASLKMLGLSAVSVGLLHLLLRMLASGLFFLICRKTGISTLLSAAFTSVWATFAHGPTGRPEDLALIFLLASVYVLGNSRQLRRTSMLAGVFLGLTFLTYPGALMLGLPLTIMLLWFSYDSGNLVEKGILLLGSMSAVSATWLIWVIPYWPEFRALFLEFALPDAASSSYLASLGSLGKYVIVGTYDSPLPLHYSLFPMLVLLIWLMILAEREKGHSTKRWLVILLPIVIALLTARLRIHRDYNLLWFIVSIIILLVLLARDTFSGQSPLSKAQEMTTYGLVMIIVLQLVGHLLLTGLLIVGDASRVAVCGPAPHAEIVAAIPDGEKVLSTDGYTFYQVRHRNRIFWPAGLQGDTVGGVPFTTSYDGSFRWLVLPNDFLERVRNPEDLGREGNPGGKFRWDWATFEYFRYNFHLRAVSSVDECDGNSGLARFSSMPDSLYLYERLP